jgi:hypothetical protein
MIATTLPYAFLLLFALSFGTGCDTLGLGEDGAQKPSEGQVPYVNIGDFFEAQGVDRQSFTISADSNQQVIGDKGIALTIPADAFVDPDGNSVSGSVQLTLEEIYSPADMVRTNALTQTASGDPLITGGMFRVEARQDGQELELDGTINVEMPARTETGGITSMPLWTSNRDSRAQDPDWTAMGSAREPSAFLDRDESNTPTWFTSISELGFINCDAFNDASPTATLTIEQSGFDGSSSDFRVYIYSSTPTGVLSAGADGSAYVRSGLPTGFYTVLALGVDDGTQYFGNREVNLSGDQTVTVSVAPTSTADLNDALSQL